MPVPVAGDLPSVVLPAGSITIADITIRNFKSIEELRIDLAEPSTLGGNWTCIVGINGAGKSSVLQAICMILLGERLIPDLGLGRLRRMWRRAGKQQIPPEISAHCRIGSATFELVLPFSEDGVDREALRSRSDFATMNAVWRALGEQVVVSYGATRNLSDFRDTRFNSLSRQVQRQMTLFDPLTQVASVETLLHGGSDTRPALETLVTLLRRVLGEDELGQIGTTAAAPLSFRRHGTALETLDLPDGFRSTVAWLADLCIAWHEAAKPRSRDPADIAGIVLIDEIDLHLHASLQRRLIPRLRAALPKVQFVATTHSPLIVSSFDRHELVILDRDAEGGIRSLDRQIFGMSMDEIYQWLMDTPPESPVIARMLEEADPKTEVSGAVPHGERAGRERARCEAPRFPAPVAVGYRRAGMRQVVRPVITLPTLTEITNGYGEGWKQTGAGGPRGAVWNEPDVRGALYAMHGRACAYCQQNLPENDRGDVEHFRPQSLYHWLAYTFENYLLSCSVCNRTFKRDRFPLRRGKRPTTYAKRRRLPLEERLLLDPSADPIEACIEYRYFPPVLSGRCQAQPAAAYRGTGGCDDRLLRTQSGKAAPCSRSPGKDR